jgi:hypothetical protein
MEGGDYNGANEIGVKTLEQVYDNWLKLVTSFGVVGYWKLPTYFGSWLVLSYPLVTSWVRGGLAMEIRCKKDIKKTIS